MIPVSLPTDEELMALLLPVLGEGRVVGREQSFEGTSPKEIVRVLRAGQPAESYFCKYGNGSDRAPCDQRAGLDYEVAVYRDVLARLEVGVLTPVICDRGVERTTMVLPFVDGARANKAGARGLVAAASWVGRFHRVGQEHCRAHGWLRVHDRPFHEEQIERFERLTAAGGDRPGSGLAPRLVHALHTAVAVVDASPRTIVHAEYFPKNVMIVDDRAVPVDWESTAVGVGEMDLAGLLEGWMPDARAAAIGVYERARWGRDGVMDGRLWCAAQLLDHLRWCGRGADGEVDQWRVDRMCELSGSLDA